ncbi:hypothetical protein CR513_23488, partial [Mucuna pruriens]
MSVPFYKELNIRDINHHLHLDHNNPCNLYRKISQLATTMNQLQSKGFGHIPSQTILSPQENMSDITLRNASVGVIDISEVVAVQPLLLSMVQPLQPLKPPEDVTLEVLRWMRRRLPQATTNRSGARILDAKIQHILSTLREPYLKLQTSKLDNLDNPGKLRRRSKTFLLVVQPSSTIYNVKNGLETATSTPLSIGPFLFIGGLVRLLKLLPKHILLDNFDHRHFDTLEFGEFLSVSEEVFPLFSIVFCHVFYDGHGRLTSLSIQDLGLQSFLLLRFSNSQSVFMIVISLSFELYFKIDSFPIICRATGLLRHSRAAKRNQVAPCCPLSYYLFVIGCFFGSEQGFDILLWMNNKASCSSKGYKPGFERPNRFGQPALDVKLGSLLVQRLHFGCANGFRQPTLDTQQDSLLFQRLQT